MGELTLHGEQPRFERGYQQIADQTWAWLQPNGALGESNSGLIASGDHVLVVDSLWDPPLTQRMLDAARKLVDAPPETLINTHSDGDHVWGNQLFKGARIISTNTAKRLMTLDPPKEMRAMQRAGGLLRALGAPPIPLIGKRDYGNLPRLPLHALGSELRPFAWKDVQLTLPTETFDGELEVAVGERTVRAIEVGPAHTVGDTIVHVPDVGVVFAADILFIGGTPIMWAGPVKGWITALETLLSLGAETYVPGHGPICGHAEAQLVKDYFEWVQAEGVSQLENGTSPAKAARKLLLSDEFDNLPWGKWDDPARLVVTLHTEQFKRDGGPNQLGGTDQLGGAGRTKAVVQMQLAKTALERKRGV